MPINPNDLSSILDIVNCISDINEFIGNYDFNQFNNDKMCKLAVERSLEIIGQAANNLSNETLKDLDNIPWKNIIGLRNKLAHDYGEILAERIWLISKSSIKELNTELYKIDEIKKFIESK